MAWSRGDRRARRFPPTAAPRLARPLFRIGWEWLAVGLCIAVVGLRRSLLIGLVLAAGSIAALRALGVAPLP